MKLFALLFAMILIPMDVSADDPKPAPALAPAAAPITYELRDLKPAGITQYAGVGDTVRQYFDFQNEQGMHHVIYEEVGNAAPNRTVIALRSASTAYDSLCSLDIECTSKAFCTENCKHMYYETANAPGDTLAPDRNKCHVLYFTCEKAGAAHAAAAPPAPAAPVPPSGL